MFKKVLLTALFAAIANFGFSQLTVHNSTGSSITLHIHSWDGTSCATATAIGTITFAPGSTPVTIPPGHVGMRVVFYVGATFIGSETEWGTPPACTDTNDPMNHIVWTGPNNVNIN